MKQFWNQSQSKQTLLEYDQIKLFKVGGMWKSSQADIRCKSGLYSEGAEHRVGCSVSSATFLDYFLFSNVLAKCFLKCDRDPEGFYKVLLNDIYHFTRCWGCYFRKQNASRKKQTNCSVFRRAGIRPQTYFIFDKVCQHGKPTRSMPGDPRGPSTFCWINFPVKACPWQGGMFSFLQKVQEIHYP